MTDLEELKIVVAEQIRQSMGSYLGKPITNNTLASIKNTLMAQIHSLINQGLISPYQVPRVVVEVDGITRSASVKFYDAQTDEELNLLDLIV
jgi:hypothetical protein